MLKYQEKIVKIGGIDLPGQIIKIEIQSAASIDEIQDEKGTTKSTQAAGYEASKIMIDLLLEDSPDKTTLQQIQDLQRLFQAEGQTEAKLLEIVNEDCAARGISIIYFKNFTTTNTISESRRMGTLELCTHMTAQIQTAKSEATLGGSESTPQKGQGQVSKTNKSTASSPAKNNRLSSVMFTKAMLAVRKVADIVK